MKALTICQPYAELIARGDKRVENRTWPTRYRGPLLIHAGKSREWLSDDRHIASPQDNYGIPTHCMSFGAVIARAQLVDCIEHADLFGPHMKWDRKYPWLREHEHTEGPWCWILENVQRLSSAVPYRGAQGLFDIPDEVVKPC